jgi:hemin uptake protein HemP/mono/diheme cytochrome c family protein
MLDYVAVDYPACVQDGMVLDQAEYDEQLDFAQQVRTMLGRLPTSPEHAALLQQAEQLHALLQGKAPGLDVAALTQQLRWHIIRTYHVAIAPHRAPDLTSAARLFQTHCAGCHGTQGHGDGPAGQRLDPPPSDFHDGSRMEQRSVYGLYNTITLGVQGTAMVGFQALQEDERWALAFYVSNFVSSSALRERGTLLWQSGAGRAWFPDLARLTTASVGDVRAQHGDEGVAVLTFLRSRPDLVDIASEAPLAHSARLLHESLAAYRQGQLHTAQQLAISAYVDGFELAEARLDTVARQLRSTVEADMLQYRTLLKSEAPLARVEAQATRLQELLSNAQGMLEATQLSATTSFLSAFVCPFPVYQPWACIPASKDSCCRRYCSALLPACFSIPTTRRRRRADRCLVLLRAPSYAHCLQTPISPRRSPLQGHLHMSKKLVYSDTDNEKHSHLLRTRKVCKKPERQQEVRMAQAPLPRPKHPGSQTLQPIRKRITTADLMQGAREIIVLHRGEQYLLRITKSGKLILTK